MQDLKDGVVRTPLPAMQTLLDDPLRAFRAVRFASRFDFRVDPELKAAIQSPEVHSQLQHKVSRERISQEVSQMLSHPVASTAAVMLLFQMKLLPVVLALPFDDMDRVDIPANRQSQQAIHCVNGDGRIPPVEDAFNPSLFHIKGLNLYLIMKLFLQAQSPQGSEEGSSHSRLVYGDDFNSIEGNSVLR